jgi:plasmid stability protein
LIQRCSKACSTSSSFQVLLKPLMHLPTDADRRRAMAAIRHGRETEAEVRRMRAETKTETRTDKNERADDFRALMARVQRMRAEKERETNGEAV